jgi:hypothetical protein
MKYPTLFKWTVPERSVGNHSKNIREGVEGEEYKEGTTTTSPALLVDNA